MRRSRRKVKIRRRRSLLERIRTIPVVARGAALCLLSAALLGGGAYAAWRYARASEGLVVRVVRIDIGGLPGWLDPESARELCAPPRDVVPEEVHLLDRGPLARLAAYYRNHEWVESLDRLEYVFPGGDMPGGIVGSLTLAELLRPAVFPVQQ